LTKTAQEQINSTNPNGVQEIDKMDNRVAHNTIWIFLLANSILNSSIMLWSIKIK
jgi:hypothetical protein